jgi:hypothetical protein
VGKYAASIDDIRAAAGRIKGVGHRTPILTSQTLDERADYKFLNSSAPKRISQIVSKGWQQSITIPIVPVGAMTVSKIFIGISETKNDCSQKTDFLYVQEGAF